MIRLETIIRAALVYPEVMATNGEALKSDLVVANPYYRDLIGFYNDFWRKNRSFPKQGDLDLWISSLPVQRQGGVKEAWSRLQMENISAYTPQFLADQTIEDLRLAAARTALARLNQIGAELKPESLRILADQVAQIQPIGLNGILDIRDVQRWARYDTSEWYIPTGLPTVDKYIGGWTEELVFILADSGVGKSTFLINAAQYACLTGSRVLYVTFELSKEKTAHRIYRRITETTMPEYRKDVDRVVRNAEHWLRYAKGQLHIHYEPAYSVDPEMLAVLVEKYVQIYGGVDIIILDYLDLMIPKKGHGSRSTYEDLGRISHETRSLCQEYHCPVISAAQATRKEGRKRLYLSDMADSYGKVRAAGIIAGLVQTDKEVEASQGRFGLLKVRDNPGRGIEVPVYMNLDVQMIADLNHPNTQAVMQRFGHLPVPPDDPSQDAQADGHTQQVAVPH